MKNSKFTGNFYPTDKQLLLLQAGLEDGEKALRAWRKWRASVNIEKIDSGSFRLLPLAYKNISKLDKKDPLLSKIKGVYRYTWTKNQLLMNFAANVVSILNQAKIQTILLKGTALILNYYKDIGLRAMGDIDIIVPAEQAYDAMCILTAAKIRPKINCSEEFHAARSHVTHAASFMSSNNSLSLDLHWSILPELCGTELSQEITAHVNKTQLNQQTVYILSPEALLFHICVHGARHHPTPPIRWVADAHHIIKEKGKELNWQRLISFAIKCRLTLPIVDTLSYLREHFELPIPKEVIMELVKTPVDSSDKKSYCLNKYNNLLILPFSHWFHYKRISRQNLTKKPFGFLNYLKLHFGVKSVWQLPYCFLAKLIRIFA